MSYATIDYDETNTEEYSNEFDKVEKNKWVNRNLVKVDFD